MIVETTSSSTKVKPRPVAGGPRCLVLGPASKDQERTKDDGPGTQDHRYCTMTVTGWNGSPMAVPPGPVAAPLGVSVDRSRRDRVEQDGREQPGARCAGRVPGPRERDVDPPRR